MASSLIDRDTITKEVMLLFFFWGIPSSGQTPPRSVWQEDYESCWKRKVKKPWYIKRWTSYQSKQSILSIGKWLPSPSTVVEILCVDWGFSVLALLWWNKETS